MICFFILSQSLLNLITDVLIKRRSDTRTGKKHSVMNFFDRIKIMAVIKPKIMRFFETRTLSGRTHGLTIIIQDYINDLADFHVEKK